MLVLSYRVFSARALLSQIFILLNFVLKNFEIVYTVVLIGLSTSAV